MLACCALGDKPVKNNTGRPKQHQCHNRAALQLEALASVSRIHNQVMLPGKSASSSQ